MNLKPLGDRLIVEASRRRADDDRRHRPAGHRAGEAAARHCPRGRSGSRSQETGERIPMDVAEGDVVVYSKYGGTEIKVGANEYLILRESDVLAKVVDAPAGKKKG